MSFDIIARPLGKFLLLVYNTVAFHNYGLAIIIFTIIVKLALLPLTLKQHKSSAKMQELQPIIAEIQKRYKDDKEKLNQEMMKVYQENNYNPASGCLPLLLQMPILITLYWVIIQPLKFMLSKTPETIAKLVEVATNAMGAKAMGFQKELATLNYFNENQEALSQVSGLLNKSELIDFNNFLGLHLGKIASYDLNKLFGPESHIYIPLMLLAIVSVVTTFISSKLTMPAKPANSNAPQGGAGSSMSNTMMYIGPLMTLMFSFQLPAGVVLYWMVGYVFAIFQQLYINKYVLKKYEKPSQEAIAGKTSGEGSNANKQLNAGNGLQKSGSSNINNGGNKGGSNKGGNKKGGGNKKKGAK